MCKNYRKNTNTLIPKLTKIAMAHLYLQGFEEQDMLYFEFEVVPATPIAE